MGFSMAVGKWGGLTWKSAASVHLLINCKCHVGCPPPLTAALTHSHFKLQACYKNARYRSAMSVKISKISIYYSIAFVNMKKQRYSTTSVGNVSLGVEKKGLFFSVLNC